MAGWILKHGNYAEHVWHICGTCKEHMRNMYGTYAEICGKYMEFCKKMHRNGDIQ